MATAPSLIRDSQAEKSKSLMLKAALPGSSIQYLSIEFIIIPLTHLPFNTNALIFLGKSK
jgi:hypothetical protein